MFRAEVWITTTLIAAGIIGGLIYNWPRNTDDANRDSPIEIEQSETPDPSVKGKPLGDILSQLPDVQEDMDPILVALDVDQIEQGDQYLLVGNFEAAKRAYVKATNKINGDAPATLLIRLAMTAEQLRDFPQADRYYQQSVRRSADGSMLRLLSLTGVARAWQQLGQLEQTQELLSELFLRYASNEDVHQEIRLQIVYQLSSACLLTYLKGVDATKDTTDSIEFKWCGPSIDAMVEILLEFGNSADQAQPQLSSSEPPTFTILQRPTADVKLIAVDTITPLISIEEILSQYSRIAQVGLDLSPVASVVLSGRSARVEVSGMPLALVLDQLLSPLNLVWTQIEGRISVQAMSETGVDHKQYQLEVANRLLRNIEFSFPREPRRESSLFQRGNLSLVGNDLESARKRYEELSKLSPNDELSAKLSFNTAMVDVAESQTSNAIKRLYFVVDQSLNQELQAKSYAWIAKLELQQGRSERAVYASSRGLHLAHDQLVRQDLLLNLAKAYLLESDPFSANRVLFNHADAVKAPEAQRLAAVLSAYARFLGMTPTEGLRNEGERIVVALASIRSTDTVSFVDQLLVGRAFFEVGFASRSIELLQLALDQAPHESWKQRVAFELATIQFRSGEFASAEKVFKTVVVGPHLVTSMLAQFKLAELSLIQKQPQQCLDICHEVWQLNLTESQKTSTLSMMGQAYQRLGRHQIAAICFSGMVPHEFQDSRSEKSTTENSNTSQVSNRTPIN